VLRSFVTFVFQNNPGVNSQRPFLQDDEGVDVHLGYGREVLQEQTPLSMLITLMQLGPTKHHYCGTGGSPTYRLRRAVSHSVSFPRPRIRQSPPIR
jgi:hypothetical protein